MGLCIFAFTFISCFYTCFYKDIGMPSLYPFPFLMIFIGLVHDLQQVQQVLMYGVLQYMATSCHVPQNSILKDQTLDIFMKSTIRSKTFLFQIWVIQATKIDIKNWHLHRIILDHTPCSRSIQGDGSRDVSVIPFTVGVSFESYYSELLAFKVILVLVPKSRIAGILDCAKNSE